MLSHLTLLANRETCVFTLLAPALSLIAFLGALIGALLPAFLVFSLSRGAVALGVDFLICCLPRSSDASVSEDV
jgi:hypothetical protein